MQKLGAEFTGTFALVFAGCGAIMSNHISQGVVTHTGIALTFGLVVMVMIYATGHISGAHFNPAVTLAFTLCGRFPWRETLPYVLAQTSAAILAAYVLKFILGDIAQLGTTTTELDFWRASTIEVVLTALLMFVIMAVATDARAAGLMAGVAIGGTVTCAALFGGPMTGASMNPARSLGPAIASGQLQNIVIYLAAPIAGSILGAFAYTFIRCEPDTPSVDAKGCC